MVEPAAAKPQPKIWTTGKAPGRVYKRVNNGFKKRRKGSRAETSKQAGRNPETRARRGEAGSPRRLWRGNAYKPDSAPRLDEVAERVESCESNETIGTILAAKSVDLILLGVVGTTRD
ncbi:hypothetical protein BDV93DRAFT_513605 [Ceratobasidium sp. AG-I]|nr:hypothetical protein BDV93DRAFT_513605 [Ceratobasidium sp. AG-I]